MSDSRNSLEIVYICKSTYYPEFRRRILSLLSQPNGARFETDYDEKWISEKIKTNPSHFKGKHLYAIFLDFSASPPNFYPLRECKLTDIIFAGGLCKITLELGNYKIPSNQEDFSNIVRSVMEEKKILDENVRKLVFVGDDTIEKELGEKTEQGDTWKQIVEHLVSVDDIEVPPNSGKRQEQFKRSLFYQIRGIDKEDFKTLQMTCEGFKFEPGKEYLIRLYAYHPHFENFASDEVAELRIASETKYIRYIGEGKIKMPLSQRVYSKDFGFWTKDVMMGGKSKILLEGIDDEFNAPSISLYFSLPKNIVKILFIFGGIIVGLFMVGVSDLLAEITSLPRLLWSFCGAILSSAILALLEVLRSK